MEIYDENGSVFKEDDDIMIDCRETAPGKLYLIKALTEENLLFNSTFNKGKSVGVLFLLNLRFPANCIVLNLLIIFGVNYHGKDCFKNL